MASYEESIIIVPISGAESKVIFITEFNYGGKVSPNTPLLLSKFLVLNPAFALTLVPIAAWISQTQNFG